MRSALLISILELLGETPAAVHRLVKEVEPWGILLAVSGLIFTWYQFEQGRQSRSEEREFRQEERLLRAGTIVEDQRLGQSQRVRAFDLMVKMQGGASGLRAENLRVNYADWPGASLHDLSFEGASFWYGNLKRSDWALSVETQLFFAKSDISDARIWIHRHREASGPAATGDDRSLDDSYYNRVIVNGSNISGATFGYTEYSLEQADPDLLNPREHDLGFPKIRLDGSWFFADRPPRFTTNFFLAARAQTMFAISFSDYRLVSVPARFRDRYRNICVPAWDFGLRCVKTGKPSILEIADEGPYAHGMGLGGNFLDSLPDDPEFKLVRVRDLVETTVRSFSDGGFEDIRPNPPAKPPAP